MDKLLVSGKCLPGEFPLAEHMGGFDFFGQAIAINGFLEKGGGRRFVRRSDNIKSTVSPYLSTAQYRQPPFSFDFYVRFVHAPRADHWPFTIFCRQGDQWGITNNPAVQGRMVHRDTPLC